MFTLSKPISYPSRHLAHQRQLCMISFFLLVILLILHITPWITYTITTRHPPPVSKMAISVVDRARAAALLATLISVGSMRRGPRFRHEPMKLGTSFGVNADPATRQSKPVLDELIHNSEVPFRRTTNEEGSNVLDYQNSSMLSFISLAYASLTFSPL